MEGQGSQFDPLLVEEFKNIFPAWVKFHEKYPWTERIGIKNGGEIMKIRKLKKVKTTCWWCIYLGIKTIKRGCQRKLCILLFIINYVKEWCLDEHNTPITSFNGSNRNSQG